MGEDGTIIYFSLSENSAVGTKHLAEKGEKSEVFWFASLGVDLFPQGLGQRQLGHKYSP